MRTYRLFKEERIEEFYLSLSLPRRLKIELARFRTSNHNLGIETGRHENVRKEERLCKFCKDNKKIDVIEDEYHVLFQCYMYEDVRKFYISKHFDVTNLYNFCAVMKTKDPICIADIANFIASMFKIRKSLM